MYYVESLYNKNMKSPIINLLMLTLAGSTLLAQANTSLEDDSRILQGRLKTMSHGYYPESEWNELYQNFESTINRAEAQGRMDVLVRLTLSQSHVLNKVFKRERDAVSTLDRLIKKYPQTSEPEFRRAYISLAEILAELGDEEAISRLMTRYKISQLFDPAPMAYELARSGPYSQPVILARAGGNSSITMTTLENSLLRAKQASGRLAPDFSAMDLKGVAHNLNEYRGEMVLLDFYNPRWPSWAAQIDGMKMVYRSFKERGLNILGIPLNASFASKIDLPWPVIAQPREILTTYRVFGEPVNILIDQDGRIIRKNVRPDELNLILHQLLKTEL